MRIVLPRFAGRLQVGSLTSGGEGISDNGVFARVVDRVYEEPSLIGSIWDGSGMSYIAEDDECNASHSTIAKSQGGNTPYKG